MRIFKLVVSLTFVMFFNDLIGQNCNVPMPIGAYAFDKQCGKATLNKLSKSEPDDELLIYEYYWQTDNVDGDENFDHPNPWVVIESGAFFLKAYHPITGCWSAGARVDINITSEPSIPTVNINDNRCDNSRVIIQAELGIEYFWQESLSTSLVTNKATTTSDLSKGTYYLKGRRSTLPLCWGPTLTITINPVIAQRPLVTGQLGQFCNGDDITFQVANPVGTYEWYSDKLLTNHVFTGTSFTKQDANANLNYWVVNNRSSGTGACVSPSAWVTKSMITVPEPIRAVAIQECGQVKLSRIVKQGDELTPYDYYWQTSKTETLKNHESPWTVTEPGTYFLKAYDRTSSCWSIGVEVEANLLLTPSKFEFITRRLCTGLKVELDSDLEYDYFWQSSNTIGNLDSNPVYDGEILNVGTHYIQARTKSFPYCWGEIRMLVAEDDRPDQPTVEGVKTSYCFGDEVNLEIASSTTGKLANNNLKWFSDKDLTVQVHSGSSWVFTANSDKTYYITFTQEFAPFCTSLAKKVNIRVSDEIPKPKFGWVKDQCGVSTLDVLREDPDSPLDEDALIYYWQNNESDELRTINLQSPRDVFISGTYYLKALGGLGSKCWSEGLEKDVNIVENLPDKPLRLSDYSRIYPGMVKMEIGQSNGASSYKWYKSSNEFEKLSNASNHTVLTHLSETINFWVAASNVCGDSDRTLVKATMIQPEDINMNWISLTNFDEDVDVLAATKSFFDFAGKPIQIQSKHMSSGKILASQSIRDKYDRPVINTMTAPIVPSVFSYQKYFVQNSSGSYYSSENIGEAVGDLAEGSLGWYYSANNTWEENVPTTAYPYSQVEFYEDGTGDVKKYGGVGEALKLGSGHETWSNTFSLTSELNDYLDIRKNHVIPGFVNLSREGLVSVGRDPNGKYALNISDRSGNVIMSANQGDKPFQVIKTKQIGEHFLYFYILQNNTSINISTNGNNNFTIENILSGVNLGQPTTLNTGFYRLISNPDSDIVILRYDNHLGNLSYNYYDLAGRLIVSISPNGVEQLINGIDYNNIDKTTYKYNHQGWLLSTTEPDAGTSEYLYRKDGSVRFSQNQKQRDESIEAISNFSYTDYDKLGRPIESGQYIGFWDDLTPLKFGSDLTNYLEITGLNSWGEYYKSDWIRTYYDLPVEIIPNLPSEYRQNFVMGAVSWTENENIRTWYSYDEQGRVTWMAQKPSALDNTFLVKYDYDFLGNVLQVGFEAYTNGAAQDNFYHYYTYDADKRIESVYTSRDGTINYNNLSSSDVVQLQAHYQYYLHGPLKRIELGGDMQGIDFVYNINGWLKQINNPEALSDDARFLDDAFSLLLNYYENDMSSLFQVSQIDPTPTTGRFHDLPEGFESRMHDISELMALYKPFVPKVHSAGAMKKHSAELPQYKKMLEDLKELKKGNG